MSILRNNLEIIFEYNVFYANSSTINIFIYIDWISLMFIRFVFFISSVVIKYRSEYILEDKNLKRFIYLIVLFVISIIIIIISPSLITILIGWDGLGLVSYALVIYYQNFKSYNAGILTALRNRIGDAALLICISIAVGMGDWNLINYKDFLRKEFIIVFSVFIVLAAITKRAQIPFSSWLPAAIAAPTPVSSLVHSSTLVTAGVYLLIRFNSFFPFKVLEVLIYISLLTIFMAGLGANFEYDLKKIIALSTLSQLGIIIFILRLGGRDLAFFHLLIHALFKALLFICAGAIIHNLIDCQDIRYIGSLSYYSPIISACFNIRNMALCGVPFLSGFYSKDLIAEAFSLNFISTSVYFIFFCSIGLTVAYSIRLSYYIFINQYNFISANQYRDINNFTILNSIIGLVYFVIFMGRLISWVVLSTPYFVILPNFIKIITLFMIILGTVLGIRLSLLWYGVIAEYFILLPKIWFVARIWNLPMLSTFSLNYLFLRVGKSYYKNIDIEWLEYYGRKNLFFTLKNLSQIYQLFSNNHLKLFLILFLLFILLFHFLYLCSLN